MSMVFLAAVLLLVCYFNRDKLDAFSFVMGVLLLWCLLGTPAGDHVKEFIDFVGDALGDFGTWLWGRVQQWA